MIVHALIHTTGVILGNEYFPLEMAYIDVMGYETTIHIKSPIDFMTAQREYPNARPDAVMSKYMGVSTNQWKQFLKRQYESLQAQCGTPHIVFGCKGNSNQMQVLKQADIPIVVNMETLNMPSLAALKNMYPHLVLPNCPWHVKPTDKCARLSVVLMAMFQQNSVLPLSQQ